MEIRPIRSEEDYDVALATIDSLMDAKSGTADGDLLDVLATLVEAYERQQYPIAPPHPLAAITHHMESQGLTRRDLEKVLRCASGRVSEILNGKRPLTLPMIRRLNEQWDIPAEILIQKRGKAETAVAISDWK